MGLEMTGWGSSSPCAPSFSICFFFNRKYCLCLVIADYSWTRNIVNIVK